MDAREKVMCVKCKFLFYKMDTTEYLGKVFCFGCLRQAFGYNTSPVYKHLFGRATPRSLDVLTELVQRNMIDCDQFKYFGGWMTLQNAPASFLRIAGDFAWRYNHESEHRPTKSAVLELFASLKNSLADGLTDWDALDSFSEL